MKAVVQRVSAARCIADGELTGEISQGLFILFCAEKGDSAERAEQLAAKCAALRIFVDENDKMNLSALDTGGEILVISNFTLAADARKGHRPSFINAMEPEEAQRIYLCFAAALERQGVSKVALGRFGAHMEITSALDGPVTILFC